MSETDWGESVCMAHPHDTREDEALCSARFQLAAARREVETVTKDHAGVVAQYDALNAGRQLLHDANEMLRADLATARAALEDVRRVEAWLRGDASRSLQKSVGHFVARDDDYANPRSLYADSLESLGRALAQEAPPCRYCNGQGWAAVDGGNGEPIQVGCQFCNGTGTLAQEAGDVQ